MPGTILPNHWNKNNLRYQTSTPSRMALTGSLFLLFTITGLAQGGRNPTATPDSVEATDISIDTSEVFVLQAGYPDQDHILPDTFLGDYFTQYDPIRTATVPHGHLGNLGSPHHPLFYQPIYRRGFDLGFHQFDLYRQSHHTFPFYRVEQAFSRAEFTQGPTQEDIYFKAQFSRTFANNLNFTINYKRINNQGPITYQRAIDNSFGTGLWFQSNRKRYQGFLTFISNEHQLEDNGGIVREIPSPLGGVAIVNPVLLQVNTQTASTRYASRAYAYTQLYKPFNKVDSLHTAEGDPVPLLFRHEALVQSGSYKFFETEAEGLAALYGPFAVDDRGLRNYLEYTTIQNEIQVASYQVRRDTTGTLNMQNLLEAGLRHQYFDLYQEPTDQNINNLFVIGRLRLSLSDRLVLNGRMHYGLLDNRNDYRLEGHLLLNFGKAGTFTADLINQQYRPTLMENRLYVTQQLFWDNNFAATNSTTVAAKYELPFANLGFEGRYNLLNNYVYFDTAGIAQQTSTPVNIPQLVATGTLQFWQFYLDNTVYLQLPPEDFIQLPNYYSDHSLYFMGPLFKSAMIARLGLDLRMNSPYFVQAYNPLTGQFHLQDEQQTSWQYLLDAYITFKVEKFRFLFRYENFLPFLVRDYYYFTASQPIVQGGIRFGISWEFVD